MRFAVIVHPHHLQQAREAYPWLKKIPDSLVLRFMPYLPPAKLGTITTGDGSVGEVLTCPLLPDHFAHTAPEFIERKITTCLAKAERQGAQIAGLEGLTAYFLDKGQAQTNPGKMALTTGVRLSTVALLEAAQIMAEEQGLRWEQAEVVIAGASGQEGKTWTCLLARKTRTLTLLQTEMGGDQGLASKIIYETGLALKVTTDPQLALTRADIIFLHQLDPKIMQENILFKPGALVCNILPGTGWKEVLRQCKDIVYLENPVLQAPPDIAWTERLDYSAGMSVALGETIVMVLEKENAWFHPGRDITIRQVEDMSLLTHKHGFQVHSDAEKSR